MASTIVEVQLPSGVTATLSLYADGSDTLANSGGADTLTEQTNRLGMYLATVTEALAGVYFAKVLIGSSVLYTGWVRLLDTTNTYTVQDGKASVLALPNAAADGAGGLPVNDAGGLDLDAKLAETNEITAARLATLTDWINGGRLDLILDIIAQDTTTDLPGTLATLAVAATALDNTVWTNAKAAFIDAAISGLATLAAQSTMQTDVTAILLDTGTTIPAAIPTAAQNFTAVLTTALTESYAADGSPPTLAQAILLIQQALVDFEIVTTSNTIYKLDGTTPAAVLTLDSATLPTLAHRTS